MGVSPGKPLPDVEIVGDSAKRCEQENNIKGWGGGRLISLLPLYNMKISIHVINRSLGRL